LVTLLEEMPVQETADAVADLGASGIRLGAVVVNQVREPLVDERALATVSTDEAAATAEIQAQLAAVGVRASARTVTGLVEQARGHVARVALERDLGDEVAALGLPRVDLVALSEGVEAGGVAVLAGELTGQGWR
ncbi:MAG: ATPase, partial [Dermatophilaceae bacterium]